jgi:very-short-patch-repair endonuclease
MTDVERDLWYQLRAKRFEGFKFKRQAPMKQYIADFVCFDKKLTIELDGGQHSAQIEYDSKRDAFFTDQGFRVLRFWNNEVVENMEGVLITIQQALKNAPLPNPSPQPLSHKGRGALVADLTSPRGEGLAALASPRREGFAALTSPSPLVGEGRGEGAI